MAEALREAEAVHTAQLEHRAAEAEAVLTAQAAEAEAALKLQAAEGEGGQAAVV